MQTNVHIDTKNLGPSPEHRIKGQQRTIETKHRHHAYSSSSSSNSRPQCSLQLQKARAVHELSPPLFSHALHPGFALVS
ncbi:hypothetical protein TcasGA2_TC033774 [Tribolium castaneum]|uniref:Alpha-carbonic anhydrase domain-containing protein n=1 Tax=Tribolium castaneum TaxID=7070 RepID=A0A139WEP8_TRICA|nr:hypothetical protein TcasGA2_TC033774 [Tribolium castaneum]